MNKEKMGAFIRKLRKEKNLSTEKLSEVFSQNNCDASPVAISSWEKGKSIPEIYNLLFLSKFFNVSVDEILDGGKSIEKKNLLDRYYIAKKEIPNFGKDDNIFEYYQSQYLMIQTRHKELLNKYFADTANFEEKTELRFLINNFYCTSDSVERSNPYKILKEIKDDKELRDEEKYWKFRMCELYPNDTEKIGLYDEDTQLDKLTLKRVKAFDDWELDIELMDFINYCKRTKDCTYSSGSIKRYEQSKKKSYNPEEIQKNTIKFLIKHGAKLNKVVSCNFETINDSTKTYMETVEELITKWMRPIEIFLTDDDEKIIYNIPNTPRNRLFKDHFSDIVLEMEKSSYSKDEIFNLVYNNPTVPDEVILKIASTQHLSNETEIKYVKADFLGILGYFIKAWEKYYQDEHVQYQKDMEFLEEYKNLDGISDEYPYKVHKELKGTKNTFHNDFCKMSYQEYKESRDSKRTEELLKDLDNLSINEVFEKYFIRG